MKSIKKLTAAGVMLVCMATVISGCTLFGLKKQTDFNRPTNIDTLNANLGKSAWAYLKSRAYGSKTDTVFRRMYDAIIYSGIDTNEYIKPNRTFVFLTNGAVSTAKTGIWALYFTGSKKAAKSWKDYPAADIKNYLSYLIVPGQYSHYNLPLTDVEVPTLAAPGVYSTNPVGFIIPNFLPTNTKSTMRFRVQNSSPSNTSDYPLVLNSSINVTTSDLLATNGVIQAMGVPVSPVLPQ
jgi:hypothetical protein